MCSLGYWCRFLKNYSVMYLGVHSLHNFLEILLLAANIAFFKNALFGRLGQLTKILEIILKDFLFKLSHEINCNEKLIAFQKRE